MDRMPAADNVTAEQRITKGAVDLPRTAALDVYGNMTVSYGKVI